VLFLGAAMALTFTRVYLVMSCEALIDVNP